MPAAEFVERLQTEDREFADAQLRRAMGEPAPVAPAAVANPAPARTLVD